MSARRRQRRAGRPALTLMIGLAGLLASAAVATAAPTVTMQASVGAIPRNLLAAKGAMWPHTGGAGEGAELSASFTIQGTEEAGLPAPLRQVVVSLPAGSQVRMSGFGRCRFGPHENWHKTGNAPPCPGRSLAGAATEALDLANFAGTDISEPIRQGLYFNSSGKLAFWILGLGQWLSLGGGGIRGSLTPSGGRYQLAENLPAINGSGAILQPQAISVAVGSAYRQGRRLVSLLTLPKRCPAGGYPITAKLSFGEGSEGEWQSVTVVTKAACG